MTGRRVLPGPWRLGAVLIALVVAGLGVWAVTR